MEGVIDFMMELYDRWNAMNPADNSKSLTHPDSTTIGKPNSEQARFFTM